MGVTAAAGPKQEEWLMRSNRIVLALAGFFLAFSPFAAAADADEAARAERWAELRGAIFGDRVIADGAGLLTIEAPARAADAAIVPVRVAFAEKLRPELKELYLVIDENPSPLAGRFSFGPSAALAEVATRVRVDDYTYLRAVAETKDGKLYAVAHFIKAAGGCSAPAGKDQELALARLGRMKMTLRGRPELGKPLEAQLLVSHPNNSGMQMDQLTRHYVPADFVRNIRVSYNGETVLTLESDISISEDPSLSFAFVPSEPVGEITTEVEDSRNRRFEESWPVRVEPGT
jgi:sulfur-oxidizing protein SoxY